MRRILIHILAQDITQKMQEKLFRAGEKTLPDARPYIKEMIVRYFLLVIAPNLAVLFFFLHLCSRSKCMFLVTRSVCFDKIFIIYTFLIELKTHFSGLLP